MGLYLQEVSRDKGRIFSALKENISQQLAERADKYIPCHLRRVRSLPPTLTYAWMFSLQRELKTQKWVFQSPAQGKK